MACTESSRFITKTTKRIQFVNSISEISWENVCSTFAAVLNLKRNGRELKGPCPRCGGDDRFWIRPGHKLPVIFGCRAGCAFSDIAKELSDRGLVSNERLSKEAIMQFKSESPVVYQMYIWAMTVIDLVCEDGCCEEDDIDVLVDAIRIKDRADRNGVTKMDVDYVWNVAAMRERGVIHEYI